MFANISGFIIGTIIWANFPSPEISF